MVNQTLRYVWPSPGLVRCIYTFGISCRLTEFCHAQNSLCVHLCTIAQVSRAISSQLRHLSTIGKKTRLSSNTSSTRPVNRVNFGLLTAEIGSGVWGTLQISKGFASWQRYCTASSSGRQLNFAALKRGRHLCSAGRPSGWALAHILVRYVFAVIIEWWIKIIIMPRAEVEYCRQWHEHTDITTEW